MMGWSDGKVQFKGTEYWVRIRPPCNTFVSNPIGALKKTLELYLIFHGPLNLQWIISSQKKDFSLTYITIKGIVSHISKCGKGSYIAKLDLVWTIKQILLRPDDWELWVFTFDPREHIWQKHTVTLFRSFYVLVWEVRHTWSSSACNIGQQSEKYLPFSRCLHNLGHRCIKVSSQPQPHVRHFNALEFEVQPFKLVSPSTCVEVLGIVVDSNLHQLITLSQETIPGSL